MTEITIELPDELARAIEQRATELGTTPDRLVSAVVSDAAVALESDCDWICR